MKKFLNNLPLILLLLVELASGILLLVKPMEYTAVIIKVFGVVVLVNAVIYLVRAFRYKPEGKFMNVPWFVAALIALGIGLLLLLGTDFIISLFPIIAIFFGIVLIIIGFFKLQSWWNLKRVGAPVSFLSLITGILGIVLGVILLFHPGTSTEIAIRIAGVFLIIQSIADLLAVVFNIK